MCRQVLAEYQLALIDVGRQHRLYANLAVATTMPIAGSSGAVVVTGERCGLEKAGRT